MFGTQMCIKSKAGKVFLKPFEKEEIANSRVAWMLSDYAVTKNVGLMGSMSVADEAEWWENVRQDRKSIVWGIYLDESELLGTTSIRIKSPNHLGSTGFMIYDKSYWRKGIATNSHIARTFYAVHVLNLKTITSEVVSSNIGSFKALQKVGYFLIGQDLGSCYVDGRFKNFLRLQWVNPDYSDQILADGVPDHMQYQVDCALNVARATLKIAEDKVVF